MTIPGLRSATLLFALLLAPVWTGAAAVPVAPGPLEFGTTVTIRFAIGKGG